jgi:integrase
LGKLPYSFPRALREDNQVKLTARAVAALQLDGKTDLIVFDDDLHGFGFRLRRSAGGKVLRSWVVQFKKSSSTRRITLGSAEVLGIEAARTQAKKLLGRVAIGEDPAADRRERRAADALTLRKQADEYLAAKAKELRPRSLVEATRYLTHPKYFGVLHHKPLDTITLKDVAARIGAIQRELGNATAARARSVLSSFFVSRMRAGVCAANPVINSDQPKTTARSRVLTPNELVSIWKACGDDAYGKIVRLLILLGARRQEIGGIAWSELDLESPQPPWTLPAVRSKNGRAHTLPLMPMASAIIRSVPRLVSRDLLFGTRAVDGYRAWGESKRALDRRCGVAGWTIHDVRRSVATMMADIGVQPHIIEQILNHQSGHKAGPAGIYNRSSYQREVRAALALWEDHIRTLLDGGERKVVAFPGVQID